MWGLQVASDVEILTAIGDVLIAHAPVDWRVEQNFQSTGQARTNAATLYFAKMGDLLVGSPKRTSVWDAATGTFSMVNRQFYQSTVRVQGFANVDHPESTLTPADVAALGAMALGTDDARAMLRKIGVSPLRIVSLPAVGVQDERDRWEIPATFDFLMTHSRDMVRAQPSALVGDLSIHAV